MTDDEKAILVCAYRYSAGRHSYMPYLVLGHIKSKINDMSLPQLRQFSQELEARIDGADHFCKWDTEAEMASTVSLLNEIGTRIRDMQEADRGDWP